MQLSDVAVGHPTMLALELVGDAAAPALDPGAEVEVAPALDDSRGAALVRCGSTVISVAPADIPTTLALRDLLDIDAPRIAWIAGRTRGGLVLQARSFPATRVYDQPVRVAVDDTALDDVRQRMRRPDADADQARRWLSEQCLLPAAPEADLALPKRLIASAGPTSDIAHALRLHGRDIVVDVLLGPDEARVTRIVAGRHSADAPLTLLHADWAFTDATHAAVAAADQRHVLDRLVQDSQGYLHLWQRYADLEEGSVLRRHAAAGVARYDHVTLDNGTWRFHLEGQGARAFLEQLTTGDIRMLDAAARRPALPVTGDLERPEEDELYSAGLVRVDLDQAAVELRGVNADLKPPPTGFLRPSLLLERVSFQRRRRAMTAIASGSGPLPWLGLLMEQRDAPVPKRRPVQALSPAARRHFPDGPTPMQELAIKTALNTPDVAVIQGPPGTGKTQVIAALQTMLAEIEGSEAAIGRTILLSSYQHDAVDHVVSRTTVMGLPAVKVGRRFGEAEQQDGDAFETWRQERVDRLSAQTQRVREALKRRWTLRALVLRYAAAPSSGDETRKLLLTAADVLQGASLLSVVIRLRRLADLQVQPPRDPPTDDQGLVRLRAVLADLPAAVVEFEGNGATRAMRAYALLKRSDVVREEELTAVGRLSDWLDGAPPVEIAEAALRAADEVLARVDAPVAADLAGWPDADVLSALQAAEEQLEESLAGSADAAELAVARFAEALANDDLAARELAQTYAAVLAATCQQAASRPMRDLMGDSSTHFPSVIVDEAARANPLDLMIPMSLASRRVVLVGDQRQLPHVLEPEIERELTEHADERTRGELQESLFQRLFEHLEMAGQSSGIRRVVTLDTQYRMHPVLGRFVSETFYGSPEALTSPRPAEHFAHGLSEYGSAVAAWIDVPRQRGPERPGRSKSRREEAHEVAERAARILRERSDLTVGVITFYARQREEIWRALAERGVAEADGPRFRPARGLQRLRVGTVDAFQGSEFDVVLLSLTRSNDLPGETDAEARRRWGFLTLHNRMNVAMSRQRRLLVAVGDAAMALGAEAERAVPSLRAWRRLCESEHGCVLN